MSGVSVGRWVGWLREARRSTPPSTSQSASLPRASVVLWLCVRCAVRTVIPFVLRGHFDVKNPLDHQSFFFCPVTWFACCPSLLVKLHPSASHLATSVREHQSSAFASARKLNEIHLCVCPSVCVYCCNLDTERKKSFRCPRTASPESWSETRARKAREREKKR